jgi:serine/threonine protein kinase
MVNVDPGNQNTNLVCTTCGSSLPADANFCGFDGTRLPPKRSNDPNESKVCPRCTKEYPSYAKFCGIHGMPLITNIISKPAAKEPVKEKERIEEYREEEAEEEEKPKKKAGKSTDKTKDEKSKEAKDKEAKEKRAAAIRNAERVTRSLSGTTLDNKYVIDSVLAEGGMAILYRGRHTAMDREVVIKVIHGALAANPSAVERFQRECLLAAKLNHPNIVSVYDVGQIHDNEPYLVMELIRGESLAQKIQKQGPASLSVAAKIMSQTCLGLEEAHNVGIIHRDLKTDNILLQSNFSRPDWVKIVDFGIAHLSQSSKRLTRAGRILGTPEYMAPEQFRDKPLDTRLDIYSLGVLLFEILTGRPPYESDSPEVLMMKHLMEEPPSLAEFRKDIQPGTGFDAVVKKAMRKEPDERYQTAGELRLAVESAFKELFVAGGG